MGPPPSLEEIGHSERKFDYDRARFPASLGPCSPRGTAAGESSGVRSVIDMAGGP